MKAKKKQYKEVDPPKGYHWMLKQGRYYLMEGDYKPHDGAVAKAKFRMMHKH